MSQEQGQDKVAADPADQGPAEEFMVAFDDADLMDEEQKADPKVGYEDKMLRPGETRSS